MPTMQMPPNMTTFQFIDFAVTGVATGKKQKTHTMRSQETAPMLMKRPIFPKLHREAGRGPRNRRRMKTLMDMV